MIEDKTLYLVRHAKSSWSDPLLEDRDRPLSKRGKRDAPIMAARLCEVIEAQPESYLRPSLIISSPAKRAKRTAREFRKALALGKQDQILVDALYFQGPGAVLAVVSQVAECHQAILVVSHNPDLTELYNSLTGDCLENLPTCSVAWLRFAASSWQAVARNPGCDAHLDYPKLSHHNKP